MISLRLRRTFALMLLACVGCSIADAEPARRYLNEVFSDYVRTADIVYAEALNSTTGEKERLPLRVFEPKSDTASKRTLLIVTPGGGFVAHGDHWMDEFAEQLARSGYVVALNRYRLSKEVNSAETYLDALFKSFSDQKAAIRYFVKDAQGPNRFRIDPDNIFIGGHSAGAITAMHVAYIDASDELETRMATAMKAHGGIEGEDSDSKLAFKIRGVVNLSGLVTDLNMIDKGEAPLISIHGDKDIVVAIGAVVPPGLYGSIPIHERADAVGLPNELHVIQGALHNDTSDPQQCPECVPLVRRFMFNTMQTSPNP
ncbi:MAG: alpha/beta hydrolase [Povalibacter sp.]